MPKTELRADHLQKGSEVSPAESLIAGSVSGAVARAVTAPLDTVKIRFQLSSMRAEPVTGAQIVRNIIHKEGVRAFWKGNVPAEWLYILYGAAQFTSYSLINQHFTQLQEHCGFSLSPSVHSFVVGSCTGLVCTLSTYPFDILRTRLAAHESSQFLTMTQTCKDIWRQRGAAGFFVGIRPTLFSIMATSGVFFWSYSVARATIDSINKNRERKVWGVEALCGFCAGATAKAATFPLDTVRKIMQVSLEKSVLAVGAKQWQTKGVRGFYRGFAISLTKTAPTSAVSMAVYEYAITAMDKWKRRF